MIAKQVRMSILTLCALTAGVGGAVAFPAAAGAYATVGPAPVAGSPGLPDGRVYEQVSPPNKNGNAAGILEPAMVAEPGGDGIAYNTGGGSIGETQSANQLFEVAKREGYGWVNRGAQPRSTGKQALLSVVAQELTISSDLTKVFFRSSDTYLPEAGETTDQGLLYDISDGSLTWLDPPPAFSEANGTAVVVGYSADLSTMYFRTPTGLYESHDGVESVAGVLPDGSVEPGAQPAQEFEANDEETAWHNQVADEGRIAFFVSSAATRQLYARETRGEGAAEHQQTVLVSRSQLPGHVGEPAPHGVLEITYPVEGAEGEDLSSLVGRSATSQGYVYASRDGSRAYFSSEDQLTSTAPVGGGMYEFDTASETLSYLPGVGASAILASAKDGSRFIFNGPSGLELWSETGPAGGTVTQIEPYAVGGEARATLDGSVFAFESAAPLAGFNNGGEHFSLFPGEEGSFRNQEIYRYDVAEDSLTCVSCPPKGVTPSGNAYMSHDVYLGGPHNGDLFSGTGSLSEDGERVFFDSPDPLVSQDVNTASIRGSFGHLVEYGRDVYEWENGRTYLISSGTSDEDSYFGAASANGDDVFFSTSQGLAPGDTDGADDVYDARVPRPADHPPQPPGECAGDVCQGPPSVPALLGEPASATFSGLESHPPAKPAAARSTPKKITTKTVKCKKGYVKKKNTCVKAKSKNKAKRVSNDRRVKS
jgi:hypothetical protein